MRDSMSQSDEITVSLNCAVCGQPAIDGHVCEPKEQTDERPAD